MYSGTGFDSKLKSIFKSFPDTMWIKNGTGNQCTLSNIKINAWQIKRKNIWGRGEGNVYKTSVLRIEQGERCLILFNLVSREPS